MSVFGYLRSAFAPSLDVLGINRRNVDFVKTRNRRSDFPVADDKLLAKRILAAAGIPVSETLTTFEAFYEIRELKQRIAAFDTFAVKPARGSGGNGIVVVVSRTPETFTTPSGRVLTLSELTKHVADIVYGVYSLDRGDQAIVEPLLRPSPFFAALYPKGLSDVRVICVDDEPVLSMIRVPTFVSDGRANLHQGALGLGLDLATGQVIRGWSRGRLAETHPDTGVPVVGMTVPDWPIILDIARRTARAVPLKYLGIDIVVDAVRGPLVLEINARPGLEIQNVTGVPLRARLRERGLA
ncbi:MAG: hypothetical protein IV100_31170 [Myxococcales bacterium]|nr:hypothetical protein [Myxococcales bacterium]